MYNENILYWCITSFCNLKCKYCNSPTGQIKKNSCEVDICSVKKIIETQISNFSEIVLTGGEPLLHTQFFDICRMIKKYDCQIRIVTNGTLLNKTIIKKLSSLKVNSMVVSLDSLDQNINKATRGYSPNKLLENLSYLSTGTDIKVILLSVITKKNIGSISNLTKYCTEHGFRHDIVPVDLSLVKSQKIKQDLSLSGCSQEEFLKLKNALDEWAHKDSSRLSYIDNFLSTIKEEGIQKGQYCPMGTTRFILNVDGVLYPCFNKWDMPLGSLYQEGFNQLVNTEAYKKEQRIFQKSECYKARCICYLNWD